jgi:hypothetical protein
MSGTFCPGDPLIVAEIPFNRIHRGDVVLFRSMDADGEPEQVVHRSATGPRRRACSLPRGKERMANKRLT